MTTIPRTAKHSHPELARFFEWVRPRRLRSIRAFAEAEVVIPDGPFAGRRFRCARQPYTGLWFDAIDSGHWSRFVATGPTQSGKTLSCFIIPLVYHLFEVGETVICGLPDMDMAADKWRQDILPVIEQSRYRDLLPRRGGGSRGGRVESVQFASGVTLKFMSGGGSDKSRAGFTSRVVVITETDGLDTSSATSRESDKITQLEARTRAYGSTKRIYMECTVSTERGRTWQEYQHGTHSQIMLPCPHCQAWVAPEREHLAGWQGAESQVAARAAASFSCPKCGEFVSDDERTSANHQARLMHQGQSIDESGSVVGELPATDTLGFRWSAVNNLFLSAADLAADEWRASRASDEENAEREMRQFVWCLPVLPPSLSDMALDANEIVNRTLRLRRGVAPRWTKYLTCGVDLGKYLAHWIVVAWGEDASCHVVDYGRIEVATDDLGVEQALMVTLRQVRDLVQTGWPIESKANETLTPQQTWIDAGYMSSVVYTFCRETNSGHVRPSIGRGAAQQTRQWYNRPTSTGNIVKLIGDGYHINLLSSERLYLLEIDADQWKSWVHARLSTPAGGRGALSLFEASPQEHLALAKHLTAERKVEEFVAGKGTVTRWERVRRQNHWFDCLYLASAAAHLCGIRLIDEPPRVVDDRPRVSGGIRREDGRPWIDLSRWHPVWERDRD